MSVTSNMELFLFARRRDHLAEAIAIADITFKEEDISRMEKAVPAGAAFGERYAPRLMKRLDGECK